MARKTVLHALHLELGARMVDFGGWDMPVNYGSQIEEHHQVRRAAGIFDVSHMCVVDVRGEGVRTFLSRLLANDVAKLRQPGKALYSCMLNEAGGVLDDLIVYFLNDEWFRIVVNAGTRDADLAWMRARAEEWQVAVAIEERIDLAMLAVQGPLAREALADLLSESDRGAALALKPFFGCECGHWFVARTGYTGEYGFEVMLPAAEAEPTWRALNAAGVASCGLGARDTLRLEAGMNLYGNDMDATRHPLESGLAWTVALEPADRDFVGRAALEAARASGGVARLTGVLLEGRGVLRGHQKIFVQDREYGELTSGSYSPTLECSIGFARVAHDCPNRVEVDIRGKRLPARLVKLPFVRQGKKCFEIPSEESVS
jgi:aminomethyltransferase